MSNPKTAPVQVHSDLARRLAGDPSRGVRIPWDIHVRAWQAYAAQGYGDQSAERIAERGGFGVGELVTLLAGNRLGSRDPMRPEHARRFEDLRERGIEA